MNWKTEVNYKGNNAAKNRLFEKTNKMSTLLWRFIKVKEKSQSSVQSETKDDNAGVSGAFNLIIVYLKAWANF